VRSARRPWGTPTGHVIGDYIVTMEYLVVVNNTEDRLSGRQGRPKDGHTGCRTRRLLINEEDVGAAPSSSRLRHEPAPVVQPSLSSGVFVQRLFVVDYRQSSVTCLTRFVKRASMLLRRCSESSGGVLDRGFLIHTMVRRHYLVDA